MLLAIALLVLGAALVYAGAELSVRGAVWLSRAAGISAFTMGALLFGIDLEGMGTAVVAAGRDQTSLAAGGVFGTVLFLFSAAFGAALVVARRPVPAPSLTMLAAPAAGVAAAALSIADRYLSRLEGLLLLVLYAAYVAVVFHERAPADDASEDEPPREDEGLDRHLRAPALPAMVTTAIGLGLLVGGSLLLVDGGVRLTRTTGLTAGFVGAAVVGVLTSLDEVLLEVLPIRRGVPELATGNLLGTLAAFTTGVPGLVALIRPVTLDGGASLAFLGLAFLYALVGTAFILRGKVGWVMGVAVLTFYAVWLVIAASI